jgi:hypothetical protein
MSAASISANQNLLKVLYPDDVSIPLYEASRAYGSMKKDTNFSGEGTKYVVVSIAPGAGGSASITTAIANQSATSEVRFSLGRKKLYEVGSIDGEAMAVAKHGGGDNSKGAILDLIKHSLSRSRYSFARTMSRAVWGNGGGSRGQISSGSTVSSTTITLTNRADVAGIFKGMKLTSCVNDGYSAVTTARTGSVTVASVNRLTSSGTATITATAAWNLGISGVAASDYLFREGDYAAFPSGIPAWAPVADPGGSDSFLGVNRSTAGDLNYLSGWRVAGLGQPKQQTLIDMAAEAKQNGVNVTTVFMNPLDVRDAFKEQSSYKTIDVATDNPKVGYKGIQLLGAVGELAVLSETDVPRGYPWLVDPSTWTCRSAGDVPMLVDFDGIKTFLRNPSGDDYQYRLAAYMNFENAEPANAIIGTF